MILEKEEAYIKYYRWGNLSAWDVGPLCTIFATSCECIY